MPLSPHGSTRYGISCQLVEGVFSTSQIGDNGMNEEDLKKEIERLTEENLRLKQEITKLRSAKRPAMKSMDSMSTKLKDALRE